MKKWIIYLLSIFIAIISLACYLDHRGNKVEEQQNQYLEQKESDKQEKERLALQAAYDRIKSKADSALIVSKEQGFNTNHCFLVDFSIHSGKHRFFIWDFKGDTIKSSSLCAHGYGQNSTTTKPVFSNVEGSYCSSLGRYKTGARAYSNYGINVHYKLHGLDKTNSNAFKRWVVLHAHTPIPEYEIYPQHLPLGYSQGCPVISNEVMKEIDIMLKASKKPLLLWVYN
jgi:hypothetical protein